MKRLFLPILLLFVFSGCTTNEEKVAKLIQDDMFKNLLDYKSYEPIETSDIDSAFTPFYRDSIIMRNAKMAKIALRERDKYLAELIEYVEAFEKLKTNKSINAAKKMILLRNASLNKAKIIDAATSLADSCSKIVQNRAKEIKPEFIGWTVTHRYRCKSKNGNYNIYTDEYVFNPQLTDIIFNDPIDDEYVSHVENVDSILQNKEQTIN